MRKITDKLRRINPFARKNDGPLPRPLPGDPSLRVVKVFVEGYEDVAFWRGVFDCFSILTSISKYRCRPAKTCPKVRRC